MLMSSGGVRSLEANLLNVSGNGRIQLRNVITTTTSDSTFDLSLDTWYRLEASTLIDNSVGTMEIRVFLGDSTTQLFTALTITGEDTRPSSIRYMVVGQNSQLSGEIYFDDIRLNDEAGSFQNSWPGPGKIFLVDPDGDDSVAWTAVPGTPNAGNLDELPGAAPDDLTSYNHISNTTSVDKLTLQNLGAEVPSDADLILADVYGRQGSDGTSGARSMIFRIWDDTDTSTDGPAVSTDINGWRICDTDEHLVLDLASITKSLFDSFKIGYKGNQGSNLKRITTQWVNVEWIEAAAGEGPEIIAARSRLAFTQP